MTTRILFLSLLMLSAPFARGAGPLPIVARDGLSPGVHVERGDVVEREGAVAVHRTHAPESGGTWDNLQLRCDPPRPLDGRVLLRLSVNVIPRGDGPSRLRRIDVFDGAKTHLYEADAAAYEVDGQPAERRLWIDLDRDPATWQELTLDLSTGPGLPAGERVARLSIQFTNPGEVFVRDVRLESPEGDSSASGPQVVETRASASDWAWTTANAYRVLVRCQPLPAGVTRPLAWTSLDFSKLVADGVVAGPAIDPATVRVVEYDAATRKPIAHGGGGENPHVVPSKTDAWPRLPMPYTKAEVRRPIQVSWLRRESGPAEPVFAVYFDTVGRGEPAVPEPAALGTGDALAFGRRVPPTAARGTPMPLDYNGDGLMDVIVRHGLVPQRGVFLMLNNGTRERELLAAPVYLGEAELVGTPQVADIDGDGRADVGHKGGFYSDVVGQGFARHVRVRNPPEFDIFRTMPESRGGGESWSFVDWDGDGVRDVLVGGNYWWEYGWTMAYDRAGNWSRGPLRGWFYFFRNRGTDADILLDFPQRLATTDGAIAEVYGYASPVAVDLDRDGDLDLLSGDFLDRLYVFENVGTRREPRLAPAVPLRTTQGPFRANRQVVTPAVVDWDGDGDTDILLRCEGSLLTILENTAGAATGMPTFLPERTLDCEYPFLNVGELPAADLHDWDGDGDDDIVFGNSSGDLGWFENTSADGAVNYALARPFTVGAQPFRLEAGVNGSIQGPAEARWGYTVPDVADWDGDGLPDLMYNSIWGLVEWMRNPGPRGTSALTGAEPVVVEWDGATPKPVWNWWDPKPGQWATQWRCNVRMMDWGGDGLLDVVTLDTEGYLVLHERYRESEALKLGSARRIFRGADGEPFRANHVRPGNAGRIKFDFADWDGDGDRDYLQVVPASWHRGNAVWYENTGSDAAPVLERRADVADVVLTGHTCSPNWIDFDRNGSLDVVIAAEDGHFYVFSREYIDHKPHLEASPLTERGGS